MSGHVKEKKEKKRLGEKLVEAGLIDEIQLAVALGMQKQSGLKIGRQLLKLGFITEEELSPFLSEQTDMSISLSRRNITPQTIKSMPQDLAFKYKVIPVAFDGKTIVLAMGDPKDVAVIDALAFRLGKKIHPVRALEWDIDTALLKYYSGFTDDELSKLTSASGSAEQYQSAQWLESDEEYIKLSKGLDAEPDPHLDISDLLEHGDTPELYMSGKTEAAPNPLRELEAEPRPEPTKTSTPKPTPKPPATKPRQATPQPPPPLPDKPLAGEAQPQAKALQRPQSAPQQKMQKPEPPRAQPPKPQAEPAQKEGPAAPGDAISALANTARKRFTIQQALIDLLVEKKLITERELLNKLLKLEGALGNEEE